MLKEYALSRLFFMFCSNFRDYVSDYTHRVELGVTREMEQYDKNFKVRQLLGAKDAPSNLSFNRERSNFRLVTVVENDPFKDPFN